jgi:CBS domain containing-hemolysin-like protein
VPETKKIKELLREFQKRHLQIAVVVDEFGGTSGIVSLEDVIEELVGEIHDEYDDFESSIKKVGDFHYIAQAKVSLSELEDVLKIKFPDDENYESLGGFILTKMGKVPEKGEQMEYENHAFTIKERDDTRIIIVDIEKKKKN